MGAELVTFYYRQSLRPEPSPVVQTQRPHVDYKRQESL